MKPFSTEARILLAHGGGGKLSRNLLEEVFLPAFGNPVLAELGDSSVLETPAGAFAVTTDAFVVAPLFFPGGDIGALAVCGTVNDLAAAGAQPLCLTAAFILEEGFPVAELKRITASMQAAAARAGVAVVAGDTKVVPRGKADGVFIVTAGWGSLPGLKRYSATRIRPGDAILVSGTLGDHGIAVTAAREGLSLPEEVTSDCAPLSSLVQFILSAGIDVHAMRDPTRGGLAAVLNEMAESAGCEMEIVEDDVPVRGVVRSACELLGYDPLHLANEGKMVFFVAGEDAPLALDLLRDHEYGREAAVIGRVAAAGRPRVTVRTAIGGSRILDMPMGEILPRIC